MAKWVRKKVRADRSDPIGKAEDPQKSPIVRMEVVAEDPDHIRNEIQQWEARIHLENQLIDVEERIRDWNEKATLAFWHGQVELALVALEGRRKEEGRRRRLQHHLAKAKAVSAQMKKENWHTQDTL
ncbi:MAG: PspA/IM30 family protein [Bacilli bacterium]